VSGVPFPKGFSDAYGPRLAPALIRSRVLVLRVASFNITNTEMMATPATAFVPPPHSIAVPPFVNRSVDKEQEYFSEGLTEELLNSLSRIR
jgi:hypothetical protein